MNAWRMFSRARSGFRFSLPAVFGVTIPAVIAYGVHDRFSSSFTEHRCSGVDKSASDLGENGGNAAKIRGFLNENGDSARWMVGGMQMLLGGKVAEMQGTESHACSVLNRRVRGCPELMIFAGNANKELAESVAKILGTELSQCKVGRFADGEVRVEVLESVRGKDVYV